MGSKIFHPYDLLYNIYFVFKMGQTFPKYNPRIRVVTTGLGIT
jgi:hypothetical protein